MNSTSSFRISKFTHLAALALIAIFAAAPAGCTDPPNVGEFRSLKAFVEVSETAFSPPPRVLGWPGMALFDYDNDGDIDVFVTNVTTAPNMFYENDGDGNFRYLGNQVGLALDDESSIATGVGDFDNDGYLDLIIARQAPFFGPAAPNISLQYLKNMGPDNEGAFSFVDVTESTGLDDVTYGASIGVGDIDNDGLLDLYIGRYNLRDLDFRFRSYLPDTPNVLMHNTGVVDGAPVFEDITDSAGVAGTRVAGLAPETADIVNHIPTWAVYMTDVNDDGLTDIFSLQEIPGGVDLFINNGDLTFTLTHENLLNKHGGWMGATAGDYDGDGDLDYFLTNIGADAKGLGDINHITESFRRENGTPYHRLLRNDSDGKLVDVAGDVPVTAGTLSPTNALKGTGLAAYEFGFGCTFFDSNLDGWPDLHWIGDIILSSLITSGGLRDDFHGVGRFMVNQRDGSFADETAEYGLFDAPDDAPAAFGYNYSGRALAAIDLNGDGYPDICRTNAFLDTNFIDSFACLFNSGAGGGHWITIRLSGAQSNRFGIGARVNATAGELKLVGEVVTTTSAFTAVHPQVHFGLGNQTRLDSLSVRWPSGVVTTMQNVDADQIVTINEQ